MDNTLQEFDTVVSACKDVFVKKMYDYGVAWRIMRLITITDQIYIKAQRIRNIEEKGVSKIDEDINSEYMGIVNYAVIAQIQLSLLPITSIEESNISNDEVIILYDKYVENAKTLLADKNHDYDEAWRNMRITSLTDIILMKIFRIKQIENHNQQTLISEGIDANYYDIFNYAIFALIKLNNKK
ncbi:MAG: DUF1599 domain-containing protein [Bacteroidales bacterium]|jgi:hypothetical protein|nr:DUF1599 domain-containing protein [Bacteroidales bacterium]